MIYGGDPGNFTVLMVDTKEEQDSADYSKSEMDEIHSDRNLSIAYQMGHLDHQKLGVYIEQNAQ